MNTIQCCISISFPTNGHFTSTLPALLCWFSSLLESLQTSTSNNSLLSLVSQVVPFWTAVSFCALSDVAHCTLMFENFIEETA